MFGDRWKEPTLEGRICARNREIRPDIVSRGQVRTVEGEVWYTKAHLDSGGVVYERLHAPIHRSLSDNVRSLLGFCRDYRVHVQLELGMPSLLRPPICGVNAFYTGHRHTRYIYTQSTHGSHSRALDPNIGRDTSATHRRTTLPRRETRGNGSHGVRTAEIVYGKKRRRYSDSPRA